MHIMDISSTGCGEEQGWSDGDSRGCDRGISGEGDGDRGRVVAEMKSRRSCDTETTVGVRLPIGWTWYQPYPSRDDQHILSLGVRV